MRKFLVGLIAAAVAALALAPSGAIAASCAGQATDALGVCTWGGWGTSHTDNVADEPAYLATFGNNGGGDSQYCAEANGSTHCDGGGVNLPIFFAGYIFLPVVGCEGCSHGTPNSDSTLGGFYVGTGTSGGVGFYK